MMPADARADVEVNVTHVGFPGIHPAGDIFRYGCWVPIVVDLALVRQAEFDGFVRTGQADGDGDECYDSVEVHLRAETGGTQRVVLYAPASDSDRDPPFSVELRSPEGELAPLLFEGAPAYRARPASEAVTIGHNDLLVLSVGTTTAGRISDLAHDTMTYTQPVYLAHISPGDLPELAIGLELVDFVVWDDAHPELLTKKQLHALIEWVRHGGTLMLAASQSAGALRLSAELAPLLPAEIGDLVAVDNLPQVREALLEAPKEEGDRPASQADWLEFGFPAPVPLIQAAARPGTRVVAREDSVPSDVVTRRPHGNGHVIFSAVNLRDLFSAPCDVKRFFQTAFYLLRSSGDNPSRGYEPLFDQVASAVGFAASGTLYLLVAALFSLAYVAGATFGLWGYLGRRGWRRHSWTAFALAGGLAGVLSVVAVGAVRGIGDRLHQVCVVDLAAGQREAQATALFGLKTAIDKRLDVWLPDDWVAAREPTSSGCWLRPLPPAVDTTETRTSFADPAAYRVVPSTAVIEDVRARATLKRFEGRWAGQLSGDVDGKIWVEGRRVLDESYVVNELGVPLRDCILLLPQLNPDGQAGPRSTAIQAVALGDLPAEPAKVLLSEHPAFAENSGRVRPLKEFCVNWGQPFKGMVPGVRAQFSLGQERNALLLASIIGDFDPADYPNRYDAMFGAATWSRERMRQLDLRSHLIAGKLATEDDPGYDGSAVLMGFAEGDPGPVRLFTRTGDHDFKVLEPERASSWTMYRVRIPLIRVEAGASRQ